MVMVHVETPPEGDTNRARVRAVSWIARNGTRLQKRTIAAGKAVGRGAKAVGNGVVNQITQPYSTTKMLLAGMLGIGTAIGIIYIAFLIGAAIAASAGSIMLAVFAAICAYMVLSIMIGAPIGGAIKNYAFNSQLHSYKGPMNFGAYPT